MKEAEKQQADRVVGARDFLYNAAARLWWTVAFFALGFVAGSAFCHWIGMVP